MNNSFFDTHAHITNKYYENIGEVLEKAKNNKITHIINTGYKDESNKEIIELSSKYPNLYSVIGVHPGDVSDYKEEHYDYVVCNLDNPKVVAIGEIGLDYHYEGYDKEKQIYVFEKFLKLAENKNMPVVIHSRDATKDTIDILKKYNVKGVIHSFSGSYETALEYIKMGFYLGINGVVTFKNSNLKDTLLKLSLDNLVLETDCPYLTPVPHRGEKNEPAYTFHIAEFLSNLYNVPLSSIANVTNKNVHSIFDKIPKS